MTFKDIHSGHVLGFAAVLTVPVALFAPKGVAPLFVLTAVLALGIGFARTRRLPVPAGVLAWCCAGITAWGLATALWSAMPGETAWSALMLGGVFLCGGVLIWTARRLSDAERGTLEKGLLVGGSLGLVLLTEEWLTGGAILRLIYALKDAGEPRNLNDLANGVAVAVLFIWPAGLALLRRRGALIAAVACALGVAAVVGFSVASAAPKVALALGIGVFILFLILPKLARALTALALAVAVLGAPVLIEPLPEPENPMVLPNYLSLSAFQRVVIWKNAVAEIAKSPVFGSGLNASRMLYGKDDRVHRDIIIEKNYFHPRSWEGTVYWSSFMEPIPLHPHNVTLQVWLELGFVGACLFLGILLAALKASGRAGLGRAQEAAAGGLLVSGFAIYCLSYGALQNWWLGALFLAAAFAVGVLSPPSESAT